MRIKWANSALTVPVFAAVILSQISVVAFADYCDQYAQQAAADAAEAISLGCAAADAIGPGNYSGPRWSTNPADHANWCRSQGNQPSQEPGFGGYTQAQYEAFERNIAIGLCEMCNGYATDAAKQAQDAAKMHCGFTGQEWDTSVAGQMRACFNAGFFLFAAVINLENADRDAKLKICKGSVLRNLPPRDPNLQTPSGSTSKGRSDLPCIARGCADQPQTSSQSSTSKVIGPGLLEGDSGFTTQGPAAAGSVARPEAFRAGQAAPVSW